MHLLYLDDAGSVGNAKEQYLVLGGVSVFEAQSHWITQELDKLVENINPGDPHSVELHASETYARRSAPWKGMTQSEARGTIKAVLQVLLKSYVTSRAFACVVHKASFPNQDPMEIAFEDLCQRFDFFLKRLRAGGDTQRGLVILDKSTYETTLQQMAVKFRTLGTQWNIIQNLADTPLFVNSKASRMIQLADHVAYAGPARVLWTPTEARQCAWRRPWENDDAGSSRGSSRRKRSVCSGKASAASARSLRNWT